MLQHISGTIMLSWGWSRFLIAWCAGAFAVLSMAPFDFFASLFIAFPILVWQLDGASTMRMIERPKRFNLMTRFWPAFFTGWSFGFGYFTAGLFWLGNAVIVTGGVALWLLPFAVFGLPAFLAIFYGLACVAARLLWSDGIGRIFILSATFGLTELIRTHIFTGFPWNIIGYGAMPVPIMMQSVGVLGIFGMSILTVFVASIPALFTTRHHLKFGVILALILCTAHLAFGFYRLNIQMPETQTYDHVVRIIQPSIDQSKKWDSVVRDDIFKRHLELTATPVADGETTPSVIIWPETAVPFILTKTPQALTDIANVLQDGQTLVTGAVRLEKSAAGGEDKYYNSIYVIDDKGQIISSYDKLHLVPFGEYLPFEDQLRRFGLAPLAETYGGFSAAAQRKSLSLGDYFSALPIICYEAIFPQYSDNATIQAQFLLNVTNDAWYGRTPGPHQHLRQAQIRSVETGIPLVRAANNGISVVTDSYGRILDGLGIDAVGYIDSEITYEADLSAYKLNRNLNFGLLFIIFVTISIGFYVKKNRWL